jgi:hypothetical protein
MLQMSMYRDVDTWFRPMLGIYTGNPSLELVISYEFCVLHMDHIEVTMFSKSRIKNPKGIENYTLHSL